MYFWKLQFAHLTMIVMDFGMINWWNLSLKVYTKRPSQTKPVAGPPNPVSECAEPGAVPGPSAQGHRSSPGRSQTMPVPGPNENANKETASRFYLLLFRTFKAFVGNLMFWFTSHQNMTVLPTECRSSSSITFYLIQPSIGNKREQRVM